MKMAEDKQQAAAQAQAANPNVMNVNELKALFSNPKANIPIFYGGHTNDSITVKFMFYGIKIAQASYNWSEPASN
jgi:hypothetical protein